jgi:hypothetical protein
LFVYRKIAATLRPTKGHEQIEAMEEANS